MNIYIENYNTLRKELKVLFIIAITTILLTEFIFSDIPELFPKASILGNIILKFCYSYISALIFYYLIVHFKRQNEKRNYYKILDRNINKLLNQGRNMSSKLKEISGNENFDNLNLIHLKNVLNKIDPKSTYPGITYTAAGNVNWYYHLLFQSQISKTEIDLIFKNSYLAEAELISILNELYRCSLFTQLELFSPMFEKFDNKTLDHYENMFEDYFKLLDILKKYKLKEIDRYISKSI